MLVWETVGCQLYSNAVVASVMKDLKFVTEYLSTGCYIGVRLITYYPKIKQ